MARIEWAALSGDEVETVVSMLIFNKLPRATRIALGRNGRLRALARRQRCGASFVLVATERSAIYEACIPLVVEGESYG